MGNQRAGCCEDLGESHRGLISERGVGSRDIAIVSPVSNGPAGMIGAEEQAFVQKFIAHPAVEALDGAVLHGLRARCSATRRDGPFASLVCPSIGSDSNSGCRRISVEGRHQVIRLPCRRVGYRNWPSASRIRRPLATMNQGLDDLQGDRKFACYIDSTGSHQDRKCRRLLRCRFRGCTHPCRAS